MRSAALRLVCLATLLLALPSALLAATPPVEGLYHKYYGNNQLELFWNRPQANFPAGGYEIQRNGAVIGNSDGVSFFDGAVPPTGGVEYTITAIGANGQRSEATRLTARAGTRATASNGIGPGNVRISTYSGELGELFWSAPASGKAVRHYEIILNGNLHNSRIGTSFMLQGLVSGNQYQWGVRALYTDGTRSATTSLSYIAGSAGTHYASNSSAATTGQQSSAGSANSQECY